MYIFFFQASSLLLQNPSAPSRTDSETLLCSDVLANIIPVSETQSVLGSSTSTFAASSVLDILDRSDHQEQEEDDEVVEEADDSVLALADAASRASTLSKLQAQDQLTGGNDFSAVALGTPETLAKYLTGNTQRIDRELY